MRRVVVILAILGVIAGVIGSASAYQPSSPILTGEIIHRGTDITDDTIRIFDLSTGKEKRLLEDDYINVHPALSPTANMLVFSSNRDRDGGGFGLYLLNIDTDTLSRITDYPEAHSIYPSWSPEGRRIAYVVRGQDEAGKLATFSKILVTDIETGVTENLLNDGRLHFDPIWSPDGTQIAYLSKRDECRCLYLFDIDSRVTIRLASNSAIYAVWSPDGKRIAYESDGGQIYVVDVATRQTQWVLEESEVANLIWQSNDLLFYMGPFDSAYVIRSDGTQKRRIDLEVPDTDWEFISANAVLVPEATREPTP